MISASHLMESPVFGYDTYTLSNAHSVASKSTIHSHAVQSTEKFGIFQMHLARHNHSPSSNMTNFRGYFYQTSEEMSQF